MQAAHPEVMPFLIYALAGGAIPLPLTALQILPIALGTETLPALALGAYSNRLLLYVFGSSDRLAVAGHEAVVGGGLEAGVYRFRSRLGAGH